MDTENIIKVYVQTDAVQQISVDGEAGFAEQNTDYAGSITAVNSSVFLQDTTDWIEIDSGTGDRYAHAQGNYFVKPLVTDDGIYRYKLAEGVVIEKTAEEIAAEAAALPRPEPTPQEDLLYIAVDHECRLTLLELGV